MATANPRGGGGAKPGGGKAGSAFLNPDLEAVQEALEAEGAARDKATAKEAKSSKGKKSGAPSVKEEKAQAKASRKLLEKITEGTSYKKDIKNLGPKEKEAVTATYFEQFFALVLQRAQVMATHATSRGMSVDSFRTMIITGVVSGEWTYNHVTGALYKNRDGKATKGGKHKSQNTQNRTGRRGGRGMTRRYEGDEIDEYGAAYGFGGYHGANTRGSAYQGNLGYEAGKTKWDSDLKRYVPIDEEVNYPFVEFEPRFPSWEVDIPSIAGGYYIMGNIPDGAKLETLYKMRNHPCLFFTPAVLGELSFLAKEIKTEWAVMLMYTRLSDESAHWLCTDYIIAGQVVSGATVDFDYKDLEKYYTWLMERYPQRYPDRNALQAQLGHLHSHVAMGTGFSSTDLQTQNSLGQLAFSTDLRFFAVINNRDELNLAALLYKPLNYRLDNVPWGIYVADSRYTTVTDERKAWLRQTCNTLVMKSEGEARRKYGVVTSKIKETTPSLPPSSPVNQIFGGGTRHKKYLETDPDCIACTAKTCLPANVATGYTYCPKSNSSASTRSSTLWTPSGQRTAGDTTTDKDEQTSKVPANALSHMDAKFDTTKFGLPDACHTCKRAISSWTYIRFGVFSCPYCGSEHSSEQAGDKTTDSSEGDRAGGSQTEASAKTAGSKTTHTSSTSSSAGSAGLAGRYPLMSASDAAKKRVLELAINVAQGADVDSKVEDSSLTVCGIATNGVVPAIWRMGDKKYPLDPGSIKTLTEASTELMVAGEGGNLWNFWVQVRDLRPNFPAMDEAVLAAEISNITPYLYLYLTNEYPGLDFTDEEVLQGKVMQMADVTDPDYYKYHRIYLEAIVALCTDSLVYDTLNIGSVTTTDAGLRHRVQRLYERGKSLLESKQYPSLMGMLNDYGIRLGYWHNPDLKVIEEKDKVYMLPFFMAGIDALFSASDYQTRGDFDDSLSGGLIRAAEALGTLYDYDEVSQGILFGDTWPVKQQYEADYQARYVVEYPYLKMLLVEGLRYMNPLALELFIQEFKGDYIIGLFMEEQATEVDSATQKALEDADNDTPPANFPVYTDAELEEMEKTMATQQAADAEAAAEVANSEGAGDSATSAEFSAPLSES